MIGKLYVIISIGSARATARAAWLNLEPSTSAQRSVPVIARDIMTRKVISVHPGASVQEAAQLLYSNRISGLPVVDDLSRIIGIVTEADIISKVDREGLSAGDIMSREIIAVDEETPVNEIASMLTERRIKRVPVVREGHVVGIVSRADIVHAVAQGHLIIRPW